jgi:putative tricarboxylic transport membrane protein
MILDAFVDGLRYFGDPGFILYLFGGVITGLIFGIVPGIGGLQAVALFLPFTYNMLPFHALPFMVATNAVSYTGGSITAVLLNVPGQETNAATMLDGYPMTQKGEGGRALGAALMSSGLGGMFTVLVALAMVPMVLPVVMNVMSADMVFMILLGLAFIGILTTGSRIKGLISGGLGLIISFIGYQSVTAVPRFTFGTSYIYDGIGLVPMALGIFAIPEALALAVQGGTIQQRKEVVLHGMREVWQGAMDVIRHWWLFIRSAIIGYIIGVVPGIGAIAASFIAYGQAKQTSKHPEKFGTGIVEGVIAPETANNASAAGALLTTLALGIPGSAPMAIFLGGLMMVGIVPGPEVLTKHLDLSLNLIVVIFVANLIGTALCFWLAPQLVKIAWIPARVLTPLVMVVALVAVYAFKENFYDVIVMLICGVLGLLMRKFGYNRPTLFLGFILGMLFEKFLFISLKAGGPLFFMRPISLTLIALIIILFAYGPIRNALRRKKGGQAA